MAVIDLARANRMTPAAYRLERARIRDTYGDTAKERLGAYEQSLAMLYQQSGWTQEELAAEEGKTRKWIEYRIRFGRFLAHGTTVPIPKTFAEGRFRGYWNRTTGENERQRFDAVARLIEEELTLSKDRSPTRNAPIAKAILAAYADGAYHRLATIVTGTGFPETDVIAVLEQMRTRHTHQTFCERRKGGTSWSYRIVRGRGRQIDVEILMHEVGPIVQAFKAEGRKHVARWSPGTISTLAARLEATLERLTHATAPPPGAESDESP
jgi:hypothetical protein